MPYKRVGARAPSASTTADRKRVRTYTISSRAQRMLHNLATAHGISMSYFVELMIRQMDELFARKGYLRGFAMAREDIRRRGQRCKGPRSQRGLV